MSFQRRKRSALPPNNLDVELLALESNVIEGKESREGRQLQRFGALKKKGKRRRVVVKRKRQKLGRSAPVSRTIVPTTPSPTINSKVVVLQKFNDSETIKQVDFSFFKCGKSFRIFEILTKYNYLFLKLYVKFKET